MKTPHRKFGISGKGIEQKLKVPLMTSARKFGHKKRNPITASMPGWPAPKKMKCK